MPHGKYCGASDKKTMNLTIEFESSIEIDIKDVEVHRTLALTNHANEYDIPCKLGDSRHC
jgi:hypothetical protein